MPTKYVNSGAGGTASGNDWTNAYTTLGAAISAGADLIKVHNAHSEALAADATYTITVDTRIVCVNKDSSDALSTGAIIGNQVTNYSITIAGAFELYCYGLSFRNGTSSATPKLLTFGADGAESIYESCSFVCSAIGSSRTVIGNTASTGNYAARFVNCTFKFGATTTAFELNNGNIEFVGGSIDATGSAPATLIIPAAGCGPTATFNGVDLSLISGTLVGNTGASTATCRVVFRNCDLHASVTMKAAASGILNRGNVEVIAFDCNAGDVHYSLYHGDAFGETTAVADYYYTTGGASIGSGFSWKIVTTANCSYWNPYVSPWFFRPHDGTSAVTLSIEGLRLSTTVIQDDEVWGEWSYKGTSGSVITTFVNDRQDAGARANGTAASNQTSGVTHTAWTNGTASHSAFKLQTPSTVTPAEVGVLGARVFVGEPSLTVYIDPQIRVA